MNKHVNKVRKATGRAEAITAGRQQNKQQYLIMQLMKKKESIKTKLGESNFLEDTPRSPTLGARPQRLIFCDPSMYAHRLTQTNADIRFVCDFCYKPLRKGNFGHLKAKKLARSGP